MDEALNFHNVSLSLPVRNSDKTTWRPHDIGSGRSVKLQISWRSLQKQQRHSLCVGSEVRRKEEWLKLGIFNKYRVAHNHLLEGPLGWAFNQAPGSKV